MSDQISVKQFTESFYEVLAETFQDVHGVFLDKGNSLFETLEPVTAEQASRVISDKCPTLAAQIKHVIFYLCVTQDYVLNKNAGKVDWGEVWRTTQRVTPEEWTAIKQELRETFKNTLAILKNLDNWDNENSVSGALGLLAHTAYHLGEIRQALGVMANGVPLLTRERLGEGQ